jgi:hypothetical protein
MSYRDNQILSISDSEPFHSRLRVRPMKKRACPSGGDTQRRGRQQTPPIGTHNKAAICREKYAALVAVSRKMNTAAKGGYYDVDNINTKKESFGHFQTNEAVLWLSIKSAQQDGSDYLKLQKPHKKSV